MTSGIYLITNAQTGSCYVGSAMNIAGRWRSHLHSLRHHKKSPPKLQRAWGKYGESAFHFSIALRCAPADLLLYEQLVIDALRPRYNTRTEAKSNFGIRWGAESNAKKHARFNVHTVRGITGSIASLAQHFGVVGKSVAQHRVRRDGYSVEDAVTLPPEAKQITGAKAAITHKKNGTHPAYVYETFHGVTAPIKELVARFAVVPYSVVLRRRALGWSMEHTLLTPKGVRRYVVR